MEHVGDPFEGCRDVFAVGNTALHDRQAIGFRKDTVVAEGADPGVREVRTGEDAINNGVPLKMLTLIDEYSRQCLRIEVGRKLKSKEVLDALAGAMAERGEIDRSRRRRAPKECDRRRASKLPQPAAR